MGGNERARSDPISSEIAAVAGLAATVAALADGMARAVSGCTETQKKEELQQGLSQLQSALSDASPGPEEKEASEILERIQRELGPLEKRTQQLMHQYEL
jgi:hypothetical protein